MNWIKSTVGEYCPFIYGKGLPKTKRLLGKHPVYGSNGCVDYHKDFYIDGPGIIVGRKGSVGAIHLSETPFWPIDTAFYVTKDTLGELRFTYYLLKSLGLENMNSDSAVPGLNRDNAHALTIRIPEDTTSRENLGNKLSLLDNKIRINTQTNQTLEAMAQAIFKSWFVDFDPVKAKMRGDRPVGMDDATAALFPDTLVESEFGLIPEGWKVGALGDLATYSTTRMNSKIVLTAENYISTENMLIDKQGVTTASKLPTAKTVAAYKTGDILVSNIRPYFKKIWLAKGDGGRSNDVLVFETIAPNTNLYLMSLLSQDTFFEYMTRTSKGAKMPRGDKTAIMNWDLAVPIVELRQAFSAIVEQHHQLISQNIAQNKTLEALRDTLLPKLLSGEIEIKDMGQV